LENMLCLILRQLLWLVVVRKVIETVRVLVTLGATIGGKFPARHGFAAAGGVIADARRRR
jgi:hypothetical protein